MPATTPWRTLRQARRTARLSTAQLAQLSGVSASYISFLERGHRTNPSPEVIASLAAALDCKPADIPTPVGPDPDITSQVDSLAAAHADLGVRLDAVRDLAQRQGAA